MNATTFRQDLLKVVAAAMVALFLVPGITYVFTRYAIPKHDATFLAAVESDIAASTQFSAEDKARAREVFRTHPPSVVCHSTEQRLAKYREDVCSRYSMMWQFTTVDRVAGWTLVLGCVALLVSLALGALAFVNRRAQYLSFVTGWLFLTLVGAVETVIQGALLVWLSFWLTAYFVNLYAVKLIAVAGIGAALAVFYAVVHIFKRPPRVTAVEGELVPEDSAPALWARIRHLAERMKTQPPRQIVAGIDANFFVTESPLTVGSHELRGRTLFVSLPLLRVLDRMEADAVLGHELAHFRGGDTASSAALGPRLVQYDHYCAMMHAGRVTLPVFYIMRLYRVIFEIALQRDSREREFKADRIAAKLVSPQGIVHSLIKVAAYARYRGEIEQKLFAQDQRHGQTLGIAAHVAAGLAPYAMSPQFTDAMAAAGVPHPFDSHPAMDERMKNVACVVTADDYAAIVARPAADSWVSDIPPAAEIEARLWGAYESLFAAAHEQSLAYRYRPATEEERAIVLKYFPPVAVELKGGKRFEISYSGLRVPEADAEVAWDDVKDFEYEEGIGGDVLKIVHPEKGWLGAKTTKVKLPGIKNEREQFKAVLGRYWHRHQVMREQAAA